MNRAAIAAAAILAVAIVAAAAMMRYEISANDSNTVYRLDRLTGVVETCRVYLSGSQPASAQPKWCRSPARP